MIKSLVCGIEKPLNKTYIPARQEAIKDHAISGIHGTSNSNTNIAMILSFGAGAFIGAIVAVLTFAKY